jgi:hypothetical protein
VVLCGGGEQTPKLALKIRHEEGSMSITEQTHIEVVRWQLDKLVARRLSSHLNNSERLRYQQLCDEECERLRRQYG